MVVLVEMLLTTTALHHVGWLSSIVSSYSVVVSSFSDSALVVVVVGPRGRAVRTHIWDVVGRYKVQQFQDRRPNNCPFASIHSILLPKGRTVTLPSRPIHVPVNIHVPAGTVISADADLPTGRQLVA